MGQRIYSLKVIKLTWKTILKENPYPDFIGIPMMGMDNRGSIRHLGYGIFKHIGDGKYEIVRDRSNWVSDHHYEHIATIQFDGDEIGPNSLFRLTNNVDEEWAKEFAGEQDGWNMIIEVDKPHRSSMVGDVFFDKDNNMYWMVAGHGFKAVDVRGD